MKIAFVDIIGLPFNGYTVDEQGLGGSESAVIYMAKELAKLNFEVTVFNNCVNPGNYDGVEYKSFRSIKSTDTTDILISVRTTIPLAAENHYNDFIIKGERVDCRLYEPLRKSAQYKVLWMHDTFCLGDEIIEELVVSGHLDRIFTLSDFHTNYISNCEHGLRRNFEVLKKYIWQTRNGVRNWIDWVDISKKDPNVYVYNASVTKGMVPLVTKIWPKVKMKLPYAKLIVIGGYYRFAGGIPDQQEHDWRKLVEEYDGKLGITFTGVIGQKDIAEILSKASYFIYPGAFPETSGISTLEALNYNVTPIATRFGALEETAIDEASYFINYAIEPNSLFQHIPGDYQVEQFIDLVVSASEPYLHKQKMYACNKIKHILGWDTVALQWKQHFYKQFQKPLPVEDYRTVTKINYDVAKAFGRKFNDPSTLPFPTVYPYEYEIIVIAPFYNSGQYTINCIESVISQDYDNYVLWLIDDASTDGTGELVEEYLDALPEEISRKIEYIKNDVNVGAIANQWNKIDDYAENGSIIMLLDGDDWLMPDNNIFKWYNHFYWETTADMTYGSTYSLADKINLMAEEYPPGIKAIKAYRNYHFSWGIPYTHLRTFRSDLAYGIDSSKLRDANGNFFRAGGDVALFYELIEAAKPEHVYAINEVHHVYNDLNPLNDYKVNASQQDETVDYIREKV